MTPAASSADPHPTMGSWLYGLLCGRLPSPRPWHSQWLSAHSLAAAVEGAAGELSGRVLDVGCGGKPYAEVLARHGVLEHIGMDTHPGPRVDLVVPPGGPWPVPDRSLDGVLCTQVLEFVEDPDAFLREARRCLRPGGRLVLTAPFVYNEHGGTQGGDLGRWTAAGLERLVGRHLRVLRVERSGGPASVTATLLLNGVDAGLSGRRRWLKGLLLPLWLLLPGLLNPVAAGLDRWVRQPRTYLNVALVAERHDEAAAVS